MINNTMNNNLNDINNADNHSANSRNYDQHENRDNHGDTSLSCTMYQTSNEGTRTKGVTPSLHIDIHADTQMDANVQRRNLCLLWRSDRSDLVTFKIEQ